MINNDLEIAVVIDIACPFDNRRAAFQEKRQEKIEKYSPLCRSLEEQGYTTACDAILVLVGALGSWDPHNDRVLNLLGIPRRGRP